MQVATSWEQRFTVSDDILLRVARPDQVAPELRHCWTTLVASEGMMPVGELASEMGYTRQHLARRFRNEFGLTPKLAARVVRFDRARRMLQAVPSFVSIAQVAASCAYYDQLTSTATFPNRPGARRSSYYANRFFSFKTRSSAIAIVAA